LSDDHNIKKTNRITMNSYGNKTKITRKRKRGLFGGYDEDDACGICDVNFGCECCDRCGESVCTTDECCMIFPHYYNTKYVICRGCVDLIDKKLKVLVDYDKLSLLKKKIASRTTKRASL
jgi:hypothetical protein